MSTLLLILLTWRADTRRAELCTDPRPFAQASRDTDFGEYDRRIVELYRQSHRNRLRK